MQRVPMFLVMVAALGSACAGTDPDRSEGGQSVGGGGGGGGGTGGLYDEEHNGRWMLGQTLDGQPFSEVRPLEYFSVTEGGRKAGVAVSVRFAGAASLTAVGRPGTDPWFVGVILSGGNINLRLGKPSGSASITHYSLERSVSGGPYELVCSDAVPLQGVITNAGLHRMTAGRITFACTDGAAHKCTAWGYPAGGVTGTMWDAHQACTRMVRSDYCSDGTSHTRTGTGIAFYDAVGVYPPPVDQPISSSLVSWPPSPAIWHFEAAWLPGTAPVKCLAKARWDSLAPGNLCGGALKDPRIDVSAQDCDDMIAQGLTTQDLIDQGAILLSASVYSDLALHRWNRTTAAGDVIDNVATIRGYYDATERQMFRPFPEVGRYDHVGVDGFLLRALPTSIPETEVIQVSTFRDSSDRMVVAATDDPDFSSYVGEVDGMVFNWPRPGTVGFELYRHRDNGDLLSTVADPGSDYVRVKTIGWVLPPETW